MFYSIRGKLIHTAPNLAVVETSGVAFACSTSHTTLGRLKSGEDCKLFTYLHVREDAIDLFGFATAEELSLFKTLIGVSGVGPKVALSILSLHTPEKLALCILTGDEKTLTGAPGVGKKLAQRLILELRDKLGGTMASGVTVGASGAAIPGVGGKAGEAMEALVLLGYTPSEASGALKGVDTESMKIEDVIKTALRNLVKL